MHINNLVLFNYKYWFFWTYCTVTNSSFTSRQARSLMKFNQFYSSQISAIFHDNIEHQISDFSCCSFSKVVQNVSANKRPSQPTWILICSKKNDISKRPTKRIFLTILVTLHLAILGKQWQMLQTIRDQLNCYETQYLFRTIQKQICRVWWLHMK
jgi:hypothetical protein